MGLARKHIQAEPKAAERPQLDIVIVGHVDHGKSTIVGRLLAETHALPDGKLEKIKAYCRDHSKPFEYAFLIDALNDEREQGITIDSARVFFKSETRDYLILDAPGHVEFVRNMITGAARAQAALLVIDAKEGIKENSLRHGYLLSLLGVKQIVVLVNKMDRVGYDQKVFNQVANEYSKFLSTVEVYPKRFIPISGLEGDNLTTRSSNMTWYMGTSVLAALEEFKHPEPKLKQPFRMPIQGVYKFTESEDQRRIFAGTVDSGSARVGDMLYFSPSGKKSAIKSIEAFNADPASVNAGEAVGVTLTEELYIRRGEVASLLSDLPQIGKRFKASLFWLGREPIAEGKQLLLKTGATTIEVEVERIDSVFDAGEFKKKKASTIGYLEVAQCTLFLKHAIAADLADKGEIASRFVLVDQYRLCGGGQFLSVEDDTSSALRKQVAKRNLKWTPSKISARQRAERYRQKSALVLITGHKKSDRQSLAEQLEGQLFNEGKFVYYLKMGNVIHGLDGDIESRPGLRAEHIRRMAEIGNLFLESGMVLIVTAAEFTQDELDIIYTVIGRIRLQTVWIGELNTDFKPTLHFLEESERARKKQVEAIRESLRKRKLLQDEDES